MKLSKCGSDTKIQLKQICVGPVEYYGSDDNDNNDNVSTTSDKVTNAILEEEIERTYQCYIGTHFEVYI